MRITFIGHASLFLESRNISILTDPWWTGPCFGAQWWVYPEPFLQALDGRTPDYIYLSHGHNDHLHPGTLARFRGESKVLVSEHLDIALPLRKMGFDVLELPEKEVELSGGVKATIRPTINDDTLLVVSDGKEVCVNLNDALHATPTWVQDRFMNWLAHEHPVIDYLFCGYGTASHFPNCYDIPGKDHYQTTVRRQHYFNSSWARIVQQLKPKFAFPFAADVVLLEKNLFWANEPVHNAERPVNLLVDSGSPEQTQAIDMAPGFVIEAGEVRNRSLRTPVANAYLAAGCKEQITKANFYSEVHPDEVSRLLPLLEQNLNVCNDFLTTFKGGYQVLLRLRNSEHGIAVSKGRRKITAEIVSDAANPASNYDLVFTTRLPYLKRSLDSQYGNEILFVGSGCLFEFPDRASVSRKLHEEVRHIVKRHKACPSPRYGTSGPLVFKSKQILKQLLGMQGEDLYDLEKWTVFT